VVITPMKGSTKCRKQSFAQSPVWNKISGGPFSRQGIWPSPPVCESAWGCYMGGNWYRNLNWEG
jgi:hypothetical protein